MKRANRTMAHPLPRWRAGRAAGLLLAIVGVGAWSGPQATAGQVDWPALEADLFNGRTVSEDSSAVTLEAPYRAEDAAVVPITIRIPAAMAKSVKSLSLVIDENPAPLAAAFTFGPAAAPGERVLETRVRVDAYSNIRAIVETEDGRLLMATRFVKAAGGCSAPALKDTDAALAEAGRMQIKVFPPPADGSKQEAQIKIRHPQYSGLQLNQATGYYIPANFLRVIDVTRNGERIFRMEGGISLSEDPHIRFTYAASGDEPLEVVAEDTDGRVFKGSSAAKGS